MDLVTNEKLPVTRHNQFLMSPKQAFFATSSGEGRSTNSIKPYVVVASLSYVYKVKPKGKGITKIKAHVRW